MTRDAFNTAKQMVLVEIDGTGIEQGRTYTDKKSGLLKPLPGNQTGYIWGGGRYPVKISVEIPEGQGPYRPGNYLLGGEVFEAGDFGRPKFNGRKMILIDANDAAKALCEMIEKENGEIIPLPKKGGAGAAS